jgi:DNA-binding LytR/AlgR family response regulator
MRFFILEDELLAARRLHKMILDLQPEATLVGSADGVEAAIHWLQHHESPDLMFMDIHLSDGHAFDLFARINIPCPVIFCTAFDQYAIQAFKYHSIDYLLKPVKKQDLQVALDKFQRYFQAPTAQPEQLRPTKISRFLIRSSGAINIIDIRDIAYAYSKNKITYLVTSSGKKYAVDYTMDRLEEILDIDFFRINRQYIITAAAISAMVPESKGRVIITLHHSDQPPTTVSAERAANFKIWLTKS